MTRSTIPATSGGVIPPVAGRDYYDAAIQKLMNDAIPENTKRTYKGAARKYFDFCRAKGIPETQYFPASPYNIASFIVWLDDQGRKASTISHRVAALASLHKRMGHDDPTTHIMVKESLLGLRRSRALAGERPDRKSPISPSVLREISSKLSGGKVSGHQVSGVRALLDRRDWAVVLLAFTGLLRRSEVAKLNVSDIDWREDGIVVHIGQSKTDQTGEGDIVGIPSLDDARICPVGALRHYLYDADHADGPLFRNHGPRAKHVRIDPRVVAHAVKRMVGLVHLNPDLYAGHSLRAGGATSMAESGVDLGLITVHGRWANPQTVSRHYIRPAKALSPSNPVLKMF